jgi:hypothetical protein
MRNDNTSRKQLFSIYNKWVIIEPKRMQFYRDVTGIISMVICEN